MPALIKKHIVLLLISVLVLAACVLGMWRFETLMRLKKEKVLTAKQELATYDANKKIFAEESQALAVIGQRVAALETYRVTTDTTPELFSAIENLAQKNGVVFAITTVRTLGAQKKETLTIDFSATGTIAQVDMFLQQLSRQPYQIVFKKFSLYRTTAGQSLLRPEGVVGPALPAVPLWEVLASIEVVSF